MSLVTKNDALKEYDKNLKKNMLKIKTSKKLQSMGTSSLTEMGMASLICTKTTESQSKNAPPICFPR